MKNFGYLEPIIRNSFIGRDAELKTRGICPYCLEYLLDDGRCECERPVWDFIEDDEVETPVLHLIDNHAVHIKKAVGE